MPHYSIIVYDTSVPSGVGRCRSPGVIIIMIIKKININTIAIMRMILIKQKTTNKTKDERNKKTY